MQYLGLAVGLATFIIIGALHPVVIKAEYYIGKKCWPFFLASGLACSIYSLFLQYIIASILFAVLGFSLFWSIHELFEQEERVKKGWYPENPMKSTPVKGRNISDR